MRIADPNTRVLILHDIVFRCIPALLRSILVRTVRTKYNATVSGVWLLKNEHRVVPKLSRFQRDMIKYKNISHWDTSLQCKILLYSDLHLLAERIPTSDRCKLLSPRKLLLATDSSSWVELLDSRTHCFRNGATRSQPTLIIQEGSRSFINYVLLLHTTILAKERSVLLELSDPVVPLSRVHNKVLNNLTIYFCSQEWDAVKQMRDIRNQYAHRPNEKVSAEELNKVAYKMSGIVQSLNLEPCKNSRFNTCFCNPTSCFLCPC